MESRGHCRQQYSMVITSNQSGVTLKCCRLNMIKMSWQAITDAEEVQGCGCCVVVTHSHASLDDWNIVAVSENIEDFLGARLKQANLVQRDTPPAQQTVSKSAMSDTTTPVATSSRSPRNGRLDNSPSKDRRRGASRETSPSRGGENAWREDRQLSLTCCKSVTITYSSQLAIMT